METPVMQPHLAIATPSGNSNPQESQGNLNAFGKDGFDFFDLIDIINPLQHIPVISTLYRSITGDEIAPLPRILGGALLGGPIGAGAALANVFVEEATGKDAGDHVMALFQDDQGSEEPMVATAGEQFPAPRQIGGWINPDYDSGLGGPQIAATEGAGTFSGGPQSAAEPQKALSPNAWWAASTKAGPIQIAEMAEEIMPAAANPFAALRHSRNEEAQLRAQTHQQIAKNEQRSPETSPDWFSTKMMQGIDRYHENAKARMQGKNTNLRILG